MEKNVRIVQNFQLNRIAWNYFVGRQAHCVSFSESKIRSVPSKLETTFIRGANFLHSGTVIDQNTVQAYLDTVYQVQGKVPVTLKIGTANPLLATLHKSHRVDSSAFITACNPFSQPCDELTNVDRQSALASELKFRSLTFLDGIGQHPSSEWPAEPSYLVFGVSREAAKALGIRFEQNAIIWSGADAVPELILLR